MFKEDSNPQKPIFLRNFEHISATETNTQSYAFWTLLENHRSWRLHVYLSSHSSLSPFPENHEFKSSATEYQHCILIFLSTDMHFNNRRPTYPFGWPFHLVSFLIHRWKGSPHSRCKFYNTGESYSVFFLPSTHLEKCTSLILLSSYFFFIRNKIDVKTGLAVVRRGYKFYLKCNRVWHPGLKCIKRTLVESCRAPSWWHFRAREKQELVRSFLHIYHA